MAEIFTVKIEGLAEIEKRLQALPENVRKKHVRKALQDGSELVRVDVQRRVAAISARRIKDDFLFFLRAPDMKHLKDYVVSKVKVGVRGAYAIVGLNYKEVRHGHLVEFGTKPHKIKIGKITINHPGAKKQPFMRPAFDAQGDKSVDVITTQLRDAVEKEAEHGS